MSTRDVIQGAMFDGHQSPEEANAFVVPSPVVLWLQSLCCKPASQPASQPARATDQEANGLLRRSFLLPLSVTTCPRADRRDVRTLFPDELCLRGLTQLAETTTVYGCAVHTFRETVNAAEIMRR